MATQDHETPQAATVDKNEVLHIEAQDNDHDEKVQKTDEFGAHAKTDPKEIALVRKLDMYMLVSLAVKTSSLNVLPQILTSSSLLFG